MSFIASRYIADHPRPYMPTAMPQFQVYPDVRQNIPRPTWKGIDGLRGIEHGGAAGYFSPSVLSAILRAEMPAQMEELAIPATGGMQVTLVFRDASKPIVPYDHAVSWARFGLVGIPLALAAGVGLGYLLGRK